MKKIFFFSLLIISVLIACGPAAEDRQKMHERAKIFQDSIANFIRSAMAEAEAPGPMIMVPQPTAAQQPTAAPQATQNVNPNMGVNQTPGQPHTKSK
jgi:hypothetical protein